jgi:hypothetical protein
MLGEVVIPGGTYSLAALDDPLLWVGTYNGTAAESTYDLTDPSAPVEYHAEFWDGANSWNSWPCQTIQTGTVILDGYVISGRYEVLQRLDFNGCEYGPQLPEGWIFGDDFESGGTDAWHSQQS